MGPALCGVFELREGKTHSFSLTVTDIFTDSRHPEESVLRFEGEALPFTPQKIKRA